MEPDADPPGSEIICLKVSSSENQGGSKVVSIDRYCSSVGVPDIFILYFKRPPSLILREMFYRYLSPNNW
jgi:hypothetical protein